VYDGWQVVEEKQIAAGAATTNYYTWGLDLSDSRRGAGGIGGLLSVDGMSSRTLFYTFDGNGNVRQLLDATNGILISTAARYFYGPYGNYFYMDGALSTNNLYRFSTKYLDTESDLYYYGYRYYWPDTGRWLNRDPIGEDGGLNLYGAVGNQPIGNVDLLGLRHVLRSDWSSDNATAGGTEWPKAHPSLYGTRTSAKKLGVPTAIIDSMIYNRTARKGKVSYHHGDDAKYLAGPNRLYLPESYYEPGTTTLRDDLTWYEIGKTYNETLHLFWDKEFEESCTCRWLYEVFEHFAETEYDGKMDVMMQEAVSETFDELAGKWAYQTYAREMQAAFKKKGRPAVSAPKIEEKDLINYSTITGKPLHEEHFTVGTREYQLSLKKMSKNAYNATVYLFVYGCSVRDLKKADESSISDRIDYINKRMAKTTLGITQTADK
jgi:RHS repeat-associated protein